MKKLVLTATVEKKPIKKVSAKGTGKPKKNVKVAPEEIKFLFDFKGPMDEKYWEILKRFVKSEASEQDKQRAIQHFDKLTSNVPPDDGLTPEELIEEFLDNTEGMTWQDYLVAYLVDYPDSDPEEPWKKVHEK